MCYSSKQFFKINIFSHFHLSYFQHDNVQDAIIVPMNEPISFRFNDYLFDMSLNDLLIANGILIHDHTSCRDMLGEILSLLLFFKS